MKNTLTYNEAFENLHALVLQLEGNSIPLDQLPDKVKQAQEWITLCENKLRQIESDVEDITKSIQPKK